MRKKAIAAVVMSAAFILSLSASGQPPEQKGGRGKGGFPGGPGMRPQPGQIMPVFIQERLKLSDDQKKQLAALQKEVDAKVEQLLTAEQKAELKKLREQGPGGRGPGAGGRGGFPGGRGPGGKEKGPGPKE